MQIERDPIFCLSIWRLGAAAIVRLTLKRVGIGFDHIEQETIAMLMLET